VEESAPPQEGLLAPAILGRRQKARRFKAAPGDRDVAWRTITHDPPMRAETVSLQGFGSGTTACARESLRLQ
jgi:hypothetical protein